MKKSGLRNIFQRKVRRNGSHWTLPISIKILRSLNIQQNSKYEIGVDAEKNNLIFHFSKKPVGFLKYRLNILNELRFSKDEKVVNQIKKNESWAKKNISGEAKDYLFSDSNNKAKLEDLNSEKELLKKDIIRIDWEIKACEDYEAMKEDHRKRYKKRKFSK